MRDPTLTTLSASIESERMRLGVTLMILLVGLAISAAVWWLTGGRVAFLFLPLLFGLPFVWRRKT